MNQFFFNYRLNRGYFIGAVVGFDADQWDADSILFHSPAFRLGNSEVLDTPNLKLLSDVRLVLPVDSLSRANRMSYGFLSTHILNYRPKTRIFYIHSFNQLGVNLFNQIGHGKKLTFFTRTSVNYDFSDRFALNWVNTLQLSQINQISNAPLQVDFFRAGPGMVWKPTSNFNFNPHLLFDVKSGTMKSPVFVLISSIRMI